MKYHQRDIVEVNFLFPDGTFKPHPAIIVSNDVLQEDEDGLLYLVLISSNDTINPQYSYPLTDEMLIDHSFEKPSLVKCQITAQVPVPMTNIAHHPSPEQQRLDPTPRTDFE